jgi:hypothetical protein
LRKATPPNTAIQIGRRQMARRRKPEDQRGATHVPIAAAAATTASGPDVPGRDSDAGLTAERTRQRAHEIYERRKAMGLPGDAEGDWLQAEAELAHAVPRP